MIRMLVSKLPAVLAVSSLTALGVWGHHTGWRAKKLSELLPHAAPAREDWCDSHAVPESRCIACHPELTGESAADWCKEHGVLESRCVACHPEILSTGVAADWCREHALPESCCTLCHPEIARKGEVPTDPEAPVVTLDQGPESRPGSRPDKPDPSKCQSHMLRVQFASVASLLKAGVKVGKVVERPMTDSLFAYAEVDYDRTRYARIAARAAGSVWRVEKRLGDPVQEGELLALVESPEVGRARSEYLQAAAAAETLAATLQRIQRSSDAGLRTAAERFEAEAKSREASIRLAAARQALAGFGLAVPGDVTAPDAVATLGLPAAVAAKLPPGTAVANLLPVYATFAGVVVARTAVLGNLVDQKDALFEIADPRRMLVQIDVPIAEARRVALGQRVIFRPDDSRDDAATGTVEWVSTSVDPTTRTVRLRASVDNSAHKLRAHAFGRAQVVVREKPTAVAVPTEALQWEGCCHIVFVRLADAIFQVRKVRLGVADAAYTEVEIGLLPGEVVATAGSGVLRSDILKSQLGAGCCAEK